MTKNWLDFQGKRSKVKVAKGQKVEFGKDPIKLGEGDTEFLLAVRWDFARQITNQNL